MSYQLKFGEKYLELFENGEAEILEERSEGIQKEIKYQDDCQIQLIQFKESSKKVLIKSEDLKFEVYDFEKKNISYLDINNNNNLVNIFWSQIEDNCIIAAYDDKIELIELIDSQDIRKTKSFDIKNLTKCKSCQNYSILCQFSLIALIGDETLCLITPFVSNHFKLEKKSYEKLKEALPNENRKYFDEIFKQSKGNNTEDKKDSQKENRKDSFYEFNSLFGLDIDATCYPLNIKNEGKIIDFSMKKDNIFVLFENNVIKRLSLPFPSFFDYQHIINPKCFTLPNIEVTQFISAGSQLFGSGLYSDDDKKYCLYQFFDECFTKSYFDKKIIGLIKSKKVEDGLSEFILLFSDNSIEKIEDESIYYESNLTERLKYLQQRRQSILKKKLSLEKQIDQFQSEISKLVPLQKIQLLSERVKNLENMNIQTNKIKDFDINQIRKEIPGLSKDLKVLQQKHNKIIEKKSKEIDALKDLIFDSF